jgi:Flp pilus assembly protein TadD
MLNKINISFKKQNLIVYIFLVIVTIAVYWQVNQHNFINCDDPVYVTDNLHVQSGITLDGFRWAFSTTYAEFWHPLTWLSLMLDYQFYGLNAGGYHLTNLILHILSTLLLFWLFNRMTKMVWRSAFVAALFALHPLHVESVAWIAERKDVLSAFFFMLTLCLYVYYTEKPDIKKYLLVLFCFACGLMSKSIVVTLPVILILLDYWPLNRFESKKENIVLWQLKEKIPFFVLSAVFTIITLYAQYRPTVIHFPLSSRIANALVSFVVYLEKTFWPYDLAAFYPFVDPLPAWQVVGAALLIILISVTVILMLRRSPYLFVGWLWYAIILLPVIGVIQINSQAMADRYTYLSLIGIGIMLSWGIPLLFQREDIRKIILFPAGIAVIVILAVLSWHQCGYWENDVKLFNHILHSTKDNFLAHNNLGAALFKEGKFEAAINHYNKAIRIKPDIAVTYHNRASAYAKLGQYQRAVEDFSEAIRQKPDYAEAYYNRGTIYCILHQYSLAIIDYNQAVRIKPDYAEVYYNRGNSYAYLGQYSLAIADYGSAISLNPHDAQAHYNRGTIYAALGQYQPAIEDFQKAIFLKPDYEQAHQSLQLALARQQQKR